MKLTLPQQDIYFEQLLYPNEPIYNIGAKIEIKGYINHTILNKSYVQLINQHDAYRTTIIETADGAAQKIVQKHDSELGFVDFSDSPNPAEKAGTYMQTEFIKPFDLTKNSLLHVFCLIKIREDYHYLFSVYHHIITDGWGTSIMFQRLVQNYNEIMEFGRIKSKYLYSYKDFAKDDYEYHASQSYVQDLDYWKQRFSTLPEILFEKKNETLQLNKSSRKELIIKRAVYNKLNLLAATYKCSALHIILAILYTYFGRKHENSDITIGLPVLNRNKAVYKKTVGLFMGISPLRLSLNVENTFAYLLADIKNQLRQDYRHQRLPLGKLIQELRLYGQKERLFNITLSYEKHDYSICFRNTETKVIPLSHQAERVALALYIREFDELDDVKIDFDYNLNYFDDESCTQLVNHFGNLLNEVIANPEKKLMDFDYLTEKEIKQITIDFNATETEYSKDKTILDAFKEQVLKVPDALAVKDDLGSYTYLELDKLSGQIAKFFTAHDEKENFPVAILLERSAILVALLIGVLKSGRPYVPLDPNFPKDRLDYIINKSQCKIIISEKNRHLDVLGEIKQHSLKDILEKQEGDNPLKTVPSSATAYIIYTSGSTGKPKGVEISHQSLYNFLTSIREVPGITSNDLLFSVTTPSFDISILEFFAPLISGAALFVASQEILSDSRAVIKKLEEIRPTIIQGTPGFYQMLFDAGWKGSASLKIYCGGDTLSEALAENLITHNLELWNMYGPTETTIWSSLKKIEQPVNACNIGKPLNNTQFYILDKFLYPKPVGTLGAIYIAGDGLAKGYYKNSILTKEKFIANPFKTESLLYETGDIGRWNADGDIEFFGRNDQQVKIRGYRIELGEIESQLQQIPDVMAAVVIAKRNNQHDAFLVAYVIMKYKTVSTQELRDSLKLYLPYYMVPNSIIVLDEFPLTANLKIDRKLLSNRAIFGGMVNNIFNTPASYFEKLLSQYWQKSLNFKKPISTDDNFFALGGSSLSAVKLSVMIANDLSLDISLKTIFDYPSIETLAVHLQKLQRSQFHTIPAAEDKAFYPLTPAQSSIWLASQQRNNSMAYNMAACYIIDGNLDVAKVNESINKLIAKYEILRTNFIEIVGVPYQKINSAANIPFAITVQPLTYNSVNEIINECSVAEFDLENDLLIKGQLFQLTSNQNVFLFFTHHIILDGLSLELFISELIENYNNTTIATGKKVLQFRDYSEWLLNQQIKSDSRNEIFWKDHLKNYRSKYTFQRDFNSDDRQNNAEFFFEINEKITHGFRKIANEKQLTFYTVSIAAINALIYKISGHDDICVGTVNSGRNLPELQNQMGMYAKTLVLRTQMQADQTFWSLLDAVNSRLLAIYDHSDVPEDKITSAVFDFIIVYQDHDFIYDNSSALEQLKLNPLPFPNKFSRMPIVFNMFESADKIKITIAYNSGLFEKETIMEIALAFQNIVDQITDNPLIKLEDIRERAGQDDNSELDFDFNF